MEVSASHYCQSKKLNLISNSWEGSFDSRDITILLYISFKIL